MSISSWCVTQPEMAGIGPRWAEYRPGTVNISQGHLVDSIFFYRFSVLLYLGNQQWCQNRALGTDCYGILPLTDKIDLSFMH